MYKKHFEVNALSESNFDDVFFDQYFNYDIKKLMNGKSKFNSKMIFSRKKSSIMRFFRSQRTWHIIARPFKKNNAIQKDFILRGKN